MGSYSKFYKNGLQPPLVGWFISSMGWLELDRNFLTLWQFCKGGTRMWGEQNWPVVVVFRLSMHTPVDACTRRWTRARTWATRKTDLLETCLRWVVRPEWNRSLTEVQSDRRWTVVWPEVGFQKGFWIFTPWIALPRGTPSRRRENGIRVD